MVETIRPTFILSAAQNERIGEVLFPGKDVSPMSVEAKERGDGEVWLNIEAEYNCSHLFRFKKIKEGTINVSKQFCKSSKEKPSEETITAADTKRYFALPVLFIPDGHRKKNYSPAAWTQSRDMVLGNLKNDKVMWQFANPVLDPLRRLWALSENGHSKKIAEEAEGSFAGVSWGIAGEKKALQAFARFLRPFEETLLGMVHSKRSHPPLQPASVTFAKWHQDPQTPVDFDKSNDLLAKTFDDKVEREIRAVVKKVVFNAYPFMSDVNYDGASVAVTAWLTRRLLYDAAAQYYSENLSETDALPDPSPLVSPSRDPETKYQQTLSAALMEEKTTPLDIERIKRAFQVTLWARHLESMHTMLVPSRMVSAFSQDFGKKFDAEIGIATLKGLWKQLDVLDKPIGERISRRLFYVAQILPDTSTTERDFEEVPLPLDWRSMNWAFAPSKGGLLEGLVSEKGNLAEEKALDFVQEKIVKSEEPIKGGPFLLTAPLASEIVHELNRLKEEGVGGDKRGWWLSTVLGYTILQRLLVLGGGDLAEGSLLKLEKEARHILELAALVDFEEGATEESLQVAGVQDASLAIVPVTAIPFYTTWWFWSLVGGGVAALVTGGGLYFGIGRGANGRNGSSPNGTPSKPIRGKETEVGP